MSALRLNPEELAALEQIAHRRELSVAAVARAELLRLIAEENAPTFSGSPATIAARGWPSMATISGLTWTSANTVRA